MKPSMFGHLKKHFACLLLTDITDNDLADCIVKRRTQKAKTIRNEAGTLGGILKRHKPWAQIKDDGIRLPKGINEEIGIALSAEQETALLAACGASRSRSLLPLSRSLWRPACAMTRCVYCAGNSWTSPHRPVG